MTDDFTDHPMDAAEFRERHPLADDQISAPTAASPFPDQQPGVIYAWEVDDPTHGWNIVGMMMPNGATMPLVTSRFELAWESMEVAQAHATKTKRQCRLVSFMQADLLAIVDPE